MSELIQNLPTDKIPLSKEENDIIEWLFPQENVIKEDTKPIVKEKNNKSQNVNKLKLLSVFVVFYVLNMRKVDMIIESTLKVKNEYVIPLIKTFFLFIIVLLVNKFI